MVEVLPVPGGPYKRRWGSFYAHDISLYISGTLHDLPYICVHESIDSCEDVLVAGHIGQAVRSVFLNPVRKSELERMSCFNMEPTMEDCLPLQLANRRWFSFFHWYYRS